MCVCVLCGLCVVLSVLSVLSVSCVWCVLCGLRVLSVLCVVYTYKSRKLIYLYEFYYVAKLRRFVVVSLKLGELLSNYIIRF